MKINYFKIIDSFIKNTQNSGIANENVNEKPRMSSEAKNMAQKSVIVAQGVLIQNQSVHFNTINTMDLSKLLKGLLNLPEDIEKLLSELVYKKGSSKNLESLLNQPNLKINTDLIRQMLEDNSKESLNKLLKLFQQAPGGTQNTEQIKEILTLLSQMIPKKEASAQEVLTNLVLLYLPWLPLSEKQDIEIRFEKRKNQQEEEESEQTAFVIYITTINLGRFRISILISQDNSVKIEIENIETSKEKDNEFKKEFLEKILQSIRENTRKDKINAKTDLVVYEEEKNQENPDVGEPTEFSKREVIISPAKNVSPVLVVTAQKIAKIILEADEKFSLLKKRQEVVSE